MRVLMSEADPARRARLEARLRAMHGVSVTKVAADLTETYHAAEHRPPNLAVVGESLARLPEFEVLLVLFRLTKTRVIVLVRPGVSPAGLPVTLRAEAIRILAENLSDAEFRDALFAGSGRMAPVPGGQGRAPGGAGIRSRAILIGASTGGVDALVTVLSSFTLSCPPTLIVQHTGAGFSSGLARLLNNKTTAQVVEAEEGMAIRSGTVAIAPGDRFHLHAGIRAGAVTCRLVDAPAICGHRPAVDALFHSAVPKARRVAAAILTGMGRDGAEGLLALRRAGARTFGQDAASSLVYGMPKIAAEIGSVECQLPLSEIGPALLAAAAERDAE